MDRAALRSGPGFLPRCILGVDDPHDYAADQERGTDNVEIIQMFSDHLGECKYRNRGHHKSDDHQSEGVCEDCSIALRASRKRREECYKAVPKVNGQTKN